MDSDPHTRVVFFQVKDNSAKLKQIIDTAQSHFERREKVLILVEDQKSEQFVDELLWKSPASSFLPHSVAETGQDWIVITKEKKNVNGAKYAFNLCSTPLFFDGSFKIIYEFEDLTTPSKKNLSALRFDAYKQANFAIEAR